MTAILPPNLPRIATAKLPAAYTAARTSLECCSKIDECADWANKADALASYAKQAEDEALYKMAVRIRARAIRRCGELLAKFNKGDGRPSKNGVAGGTVSQRQAARDAGLSRRQEHTAVRLAQIPAADFEAQVESDSPPSVKALAQQGMKKAPWTVADLQGRDPADFKLATQTLGDLKRLVEFARQAVPEAIARGAFPKERLRMVNWIDSLEPWLRTLRAALRAAL